MNTVQPNSQNSAANNARNNNGRQQPQAKTGANANNAVAQAQTQAQRQTQARPQLRTQPQAQSQARGQAAAQAAQATRARQQRPNRSASHNSGSPLKPVLLVLLLLFVAVGGVYAYATQVAPNSVLGSKVNQFLIQSGVPQLASDSSSGTGDKLFTKQGQDKQQPVSPDSDQAAQQPGTATGLVSDVGSDGKKLTANSEDLPPISEDFQPKVPKDGTLSLVSQQQQVAVGSTLTVQVLLTVKTQPDGIEFMLKYDPKQLTDVKLESSETFPNYIKNNVYPEHGKLKAMIMRSPGQDVEPKPNMKVGTLTATVQQAGEVKIDFISDETIVAGAGGQSLLEQTKPLTITAQ